MQSNYGISINNSIFHNGKTYLLRGWIVRYNQNYIFNFIDEEYFLMYSHIKESERPSWRTDDGQIINSGRKSIYEQTPEWYKKYAIKNGYSINLKVRGAITKPLVDGNSYTAQTNPIVSYGRRNRSRVWHNESAGNLQLIVNPYRKKKLAHKDEIAKSRGVKVDSEFYKDEILLFTRLGEHARPNANIGNLRHISGNFHTMYGIDIEQNTFADDRYPHAGFTIFNTETYDTLAPITVLIFTPINSYDLSNKDYGIECYGSLNNKPKTIFYSSEVAPPMSKIYNVLAPEATAIPLHAWNRRHGNYNHNEVNLKLDIDPFWRNWVDTNSTTDMNDPYLPVNKIKDPWFFLPQNGNGGGVATPWLFTRLGWESCESNVDVRNRIPNFKKSNILDVFHGQIMYEDTLYVLYQTTGYANPFTVYNMQQGYASLISFHATAHKNGVLSVIQSENMDDIDIYQLPNDLKRLVSPTVTCLFWMLPAF